MAKDLTDNECRAEVKKRLTESSATAVARELGMGRTAVLSLAGGFAVKPGTFALVRERLRNAAR